MLLKEWKIKNIEDNKKPLIKRLLFNRGIISPDEEATFLDPLSIKLTSPSVFSDMSKAVERISKAIDNEENILIYGDFDADGLTSTSLLFKTLEHLGAKVSYYIPTRETDGHGLNSKALVKLMVSKKPKLIITVDCGVSNVEEVNFINSFKIDVIITDHHEAPENLPDALAIINPKAPNALDENLTATEIHNLTSLAGVGVAFKLANGVLDVYNKLEFLCDILPYVAVGTIADIVPLIGENRYFVVKGLDLISQGRHYGLKRLLENAGYSNIEDGVTSEQVAYGIAPRINASGRLDSVEDAVKLLISDNKQEIELSLIALENYNKIRQELCHNIFLEADEMAKGVKDNAIVLFKADWHIGIIGIVASKLVEKYHKPAFMMMYSEETKQIRCSARGVEGVSELNLYDIISNISEKFDGYGGHALAAGFSFNSEVVSFEDVKKGLNDTIDEILGGKKIVPILNVDLELVPDDVELGLVEVIKQLEPFGSANPQPVFVLRDLTLKQKKLMGSNKEHLRLTLQKDGHSFSAIWWSKGDISLSNGDQVDVAFYPQLNTFNGVTSVQLILKDLHSEALKEIEEIQSGVKIYDHRKKNDIFKQVNDYLKTTKYSTDIFVEDKDILKQLKPYEEISRRVVTRKNISKCETLMFFDYPASKDMFDIIIEKASPDYIHYMNYCVKNNSEDEYLKTISGMIRFVCNNKDGIFNLEDSSSFLGVTNDLIELTLDLLYDSGMIKIDERLETYYKIQFCSGSGCSNFSKLDSYSDFYSLYKNIQEFKVSCQNVDLNSLILCQI